MKTPFTGKNRKDIDLVLSMFCGKPIPSLLNGIGLLAGLRLSEELFKGSLLVKVGIGVDDFL